MRWRWSAPSRPAARHAAWMRANVASVSSSVSLGSFAIAARRRRSRRQPQTTQHDDRHPERCPLLDGNTCQVREDHAVTWPIMPESGHRCGGYIDSLSMRIRLRRAGAGALLATSRHWRSPRRRRRTGSSDAPTCPCRLAVQLGRSSRSYPVVRRAVGALDAPAAPERSIVCGCSACPRIVGPLASLFGLAVFGLVVYSGIDGAPGLVGELQRDFHLRDLLGRAAARQRVLRRRLRGSEPLAHDGARAALAARPPDARSRRAPAAALPRVARAVAGRRDPARLRLPGAGLRRTRQPGYSSAGSRSATSPSRWSR